MKKLRSANCFYRRTERNYGYGNRSEHPGGAAAPAGQQECGTTCARGRKSSGRGVWRRQGYGSDRVKAMIVDWQFEPIKGKLLHVDLQRIAMDQKLTVTVPIVLKGEPEGVKTQGGILEQLLREVELECLPADIPKSIEADVSHLVFGVDIRVRDLAHGDKLKFLTDEDRMVAHITTVKEEVVAAPEVVADATAAPAEPEVIKKGKQEVEGEEAEAKPEAKPEKAEKKEKK